MASVAVLVVVALRVVSLRVVTAHTTPCPSHHLPCCPLRTCSRLTRASSFLSRPAARFSSSCAAPGRKHIGQSES